MRFNEKRWTKWFGRDWLSVQFHAAPLPEKAVFFAGGASLIAVVLSTFLLALLVPDGWPTQVLNSESEQMFQVNTYGGDQALVQAQPALLTLWGLHRWSLFALFGCVIGMYSIRAIRNALTK
jgi:hypothetical protein